ncbi:hypothetical protein BDP27DRAFT_530410 [Rhodocollybia butyracea]|uniref:Uncharacterized protein n=1 Tax=Rhodocollybia butyracea TaxID=206335 RepID=A0A9P5P7X0_9AGAR|nr:hypothetical protein BDP27DRAFT_530410 [Rhodocollybia butyracea]
MVEGTFFRPTGTRWGKTKRRKYVGISSGPPARGHFKLLKALPVGKTPKEMQSIAKEWARLSHQFEQHFMTQGTLTFLDRFGAPMLTGSQKLLDKSHGWLTDAINDALDPLNLNPSQRFPVTFEGYFDPLHDPYLLWRYFQLIGGSPHCALTSPCYGFYTPECLAIVVPTLHPSPLRFDVLGTYGRNCEKMMVRFRNDFMRGHVWHKRAQLDME